MLNHITLQGRFVRDPELRYTQNGTPVASFALAVERDIAAQDGSRKTDFIDCVAWRHMGEFISKYFHKGSAAIISGRLELRDWTDKDGNKRRSAEINVGTAYFGESKKAAGENTSGGAVTDGTADFSEMQDIDEGNLPF